MGKFLVGDQIDDFVAKHPNTSFFWGEESILPERLATFIEKFGLLPCKDCKRFFQIGENRDEQDYGRFFVNTGGCECGRVCSAEEWNKEMLM